MRFNNKKEVCDFVNKKLNLLNHEVKPNHNGNFFDWLHVVMLRPKKVKVPIYTKKWKIKFIDNLQRRLYSPEELKIENWYPGIDFSKIVWPDEWKSYPFSSPIAFPKFTKEYESYWMVSFEHEFFKENLKFGVRPISTFKYTVDIGGNQFAFVTKENNTIYKLSGSIWFPDFHKDFEKHLKGEKTDLDWDSCKIKKRNSI